MRTNYIIVGAGIYGATLARLLKDSNHQVKVLEKRNHIGGNCYTEKVGNIEVHKYGAHIFHTSNNLVWKFVNRFARFYPYVHSVMARHGSSLYNLPFNLNTFNKIWDISDPQVAFNKIADEIKSEEAKGTFSKGTNDLESYAISQVGRTIYEYFIKGYTEKQWGRPCNELPSSIIKRIPIRYNFNNCYFNDYYQGIPLNGYTEMISKMLEGIEVKLGFDFLEHKDLLNLENTKFIYTGSVDEFCGFYLGELEYRSLKFVDYSIQTDNYQGNSVINYTDKELGFTRIIEHKQFLPNTERGKTIITKEYPQKYVRGLERYYPVETLVNKALHDAYIKIAKKDYPNVIFGGRLGSYKYLDMDDAILSAFDTYKGLVNNEVLVNNSV